MIEIEFDDTAIKKALSNLQQAVGNISPVLKVIGEDLKESSQQRFVSKTGPDGQKWDDNSDVTIDLKGRNDPLVGEGTLGEQINATLIGDDTLEIGSSMNYAAMQQFGGNKSEFPFLWGDIPARPFLGISDEDEANILATIEEFLNESMS